MTARRVAESHWITTGDGRSTEELVEAGGYGYAHSCVISENFPVRHLEGRRVREIVLLEFDHDVTAAEAIAEAAEAGLERPTYEDALYFGIEHPDAQRERPVVFLHDPWFGYFGRRDVLCLWTNAGRRELGLEDIDDRWSSSYRFAFVRDVAELRERYAEELRYTGHVTSAEVIRAFARVPRERYLGPGPWRILHLSTGQYWTTPDADPRHLYHDVLVAIDEMRLLNNGQPSLLGLLIEALALREGDRVVHVGCGTGYYSAILADLVGPRGRVIAIEADTDLAERSRANLAGLSNVEVVLGDGGEHDPGPVDAVFVNAGATHPRRTWLDALRSNGRLLLPLTGLNGSGRVLRVVRQDGRYAARFISAVSIFPCAGAREAGTARLLGEAFASGGWAAVRSLRPHPHEIESTCWLHTERLCLSTLDP